MAARFARLRIVRTPTTQPTRNTISKVNHNGESTVIHKSWMGVDPRFCSTKITAMMDSAMAAQPAGDTLESGFGFRPELLVIG